MTYQEFKRPNTEDFEFVPRFSFLAMFSALEMAESRNLDFNGLMSFYITEGGKMGLINNESHNGEAPPHAWYLTPHETEFDSALKVLTEGYDKWPYRHGVEVRNPEGKVLVSINVPKEEE